MESAHPFHRLRTNTYYCLSWFVCMCIRVSVCLHVVHSSSPIVILCSYMHSINIAQQGQPRWRASGWPSVSVCICWPYSQDCIGKWFWPLCANSSRPLHKGGIWELNPSPRTRYPILVRDPVTLNPWDSAILGQHNTANIRAHKPIPITVITAWPANSQGALKNKQRLWLHKKCKWGNCRTREGSMALDERCFSIAILSYGFLNYYWI